MKELDAHTNGEEDAAMPGDDVQPNYKNTDEGNREQQGSYLDFVAVKP